MIDAKDNSAFQVNLYRDKDAVPLERVGDEQCVFDGLRFGLRDYATGEAKGRVQALKGKLEGQTYFKFTGNMETERIEKGEHAIFEKLLN